MKRSILVLGAVMCAVLAVAMAPAVKKGPNETIVRQYVDLWNKGDLSTADRILATDFFRLGPATRFSPAGRDNMKDYIAEARKNYPKLKISINDLETDGDRVIMNWTFKGTYKGTEFPDAVGKKIKLTGTSIYGIAGGKITQERVSWDVLGGNHQLGIDTPLDTSQENMMIVRRFTDELYEKGNLDIAYEIVHEDHVLHVPAGVDYQSGRDGVQRRAAMFHGAFADLRFNIDEMFAVDDMVASHWTFIGTHNGEFLGVEPTGKRVAVEGLSMSRIRDGKIVESWGFWDTGELFKQLGIIDR